MLVLLWCLATTGPAGAASIDPDRILRGVSIAPAGLTSCAVAIHVGEGVGAPGTLDNPVSIWLALSNAPLTSIRLHVIDVPDLLQATGCSSLIAGFDCVAIDNSGQVSIEITPQSATIPPVSSTTPVATVFFSVAAEAPLGSVELVPEQLSVEGVGGSLCAVTGLAGSLEIDACGSTPPDSDGDGTPDCLDLCPADPSKSAPGQCGCDQPESDFDDDGTADCVDGCPLDGNKVAPGQCGCGNFDTDSDADGTANCVDGCPFDEDKIEPGSCGCGISDFDTDGDGAADCVDGCPLDEDKIEPGQCGCGMPDTDSDADGTADCVDGCPADARDDVDGDSLCADDDNCDLVSNLDQANLDDDALGDACDDDIDGDGASVTADCNDFDPTAYPGAFETCGNGIDEDCSGADAPCACDTLPRTGWTVPFADSEELVGENGSRANAIDGDPLSHWVTRWIPTSPAHPHEIVVDLGAPRLLCGFTYLPRQDGGVNGTVRDFQFAVSTNGTTWATVASGALFTSPSPLVERERFFAPTPGRFVRLRALGEVNGGPWALVAELGLRGGSIIGSLPPVATIVVPAKDTVVDPGGAVEFEGSGLDPDEQFPLSYAWSFPECAIPTVSSVANPGPVVFACGPGPYAVILTVCDAVGLCSSDERLVTISGQLCVELPSAGWTVPFADSEEQIGEDGSRANAIDGDPLTNWVTQWIPTSPGHPHEIRIDTGAVRSLCGFTYLPRQDGGVNGTIREFEFATSVDNLNWIPVAAGELFTNTDSLAARSIEFAPTAGRYARLTSLGAVSDGPWAVVAELGLDAISSGGSLPPIVTIDAPTHDLLIDSGSVIEFAGSANDPDAELPLNLSWSFPPCAAPPSSSAEDPGPVAFACSAGTYPATFTACDAAGQCASAQRTVTVSGPACQALPRAGWSVTSVDSEELGAEDGRGVNAIDGDPESLWLTQWVPTSPGLPHTIEIDLGESATLCGFRYLPRQDGGVNGTIREFEIEVSQDGTAWTLAARDVLFTDATVLVERQIDFPQITGRHVRLRALGEIQGGPWTAAAEIGFHAIQE